MHELLTGQAAEQALGQHGLVALDWHNGNRSVLVDHELSGLVVGQTLATRPEDGYRALLEATAYGTRTIVESFERSGVPVTEFVVAGGLLKNALLHADLRRRPATAAFDDRLRPGPGAGLGDARRRRGGRLPGRRRAAAAAMGKVNRDVTCQTTRTAASTTASTPSTARCTTTSAAAATTSCRASARCARGCP